jgi:hypothetical protein
MSTNLINTGLQPGGYTQQKTRAVLTAFLRHQKPLKRLKNYISPWTNEMKESPERRN